MGNTDSLILVRHYLMGSINAHTLCFALKSCNSSHLSDAKLFEQAMNFSHTQTFSRHLPTRQFGLFPQAYDLDFLHVGLDSSHEAICFY